MLNSYRKMKDGTWAIAMAVGGAQPGDVVDVHLKSGACKKVTLGAWLSTAKFEPPSGDEFYLHFFAVGAEAPRAKVQVGSLDALLALFDKAAKHLKFPAIVLSAPGYENGLRVGRAGPRARLPGTLNVTSATKDDSEYGREWLGRVMLDGNFEPARNLLEATTVIVTAALREFAADPVKIASEYGRLTGRCCFCRLALSDDRSTAVGYGKKCAENYGLAWGARPVSFACEPEVV